jgi:uncharacterized membrane protein YccC
MEHVPGHGILELSASAGTVGARRRSARSRYVRRMVGDAFRVDWSRVAWRFALPLVLGYIFHQELTAVSIAIGANIVGFASRQGIYRTRAAVMLLTALGMGFSAFVGAATGRDFTIDVALFAVWGLVAGILASLGPAATAIGVNSCIALAIYGRFGLDPTQALVQASFVVAGGALQTLVAVLIFPLARFKQERTVLANAYRALAEYAAHIPEFALRPAPQGPFAALSAALADPQPFSRRGEIAAFEVLLNEAEAIRGSLAALAIDRRPGPGRHFAYTDADAQRLGLATEAILSEIASALDDARPPLDIPAWATIAELTARIAPDADRANVDDLNALFSQLRSAWRAAGFPADAVAPGHLHAPAAFRPSAFVDAWTTFAANCSLASVYARHGVRLAVTLVAAALVAHFIPDGRGYWVPMTVALVLRSDFGATLARGIARIAGTLGGAAVASVFVFVVNPGREAEVILTIAFAIVGYAIFDASYALFSASVTCFVIFLLAFIGYSEHDALGPRVLATAIGGLLALVAYTAWPAWQRDFVGIDLARMVEAQRRYAAVIFKAIADPEHRNETVIHDALVETWLSRTNAEAAVDRFLGEPVRPAAISVRSALGVLATSRRLGTASLTLHARLTRTAQPLPIVESFAAELDRELASVADALRTRTAPTESLALRDQQAVLAKALADLPGEPGIVQAETDVITESVETLARLLRRLRRAQAGSPTRQRERAR